MNIRQKPEEIYEEYLRGVEYNESIGLYDTVRRNENFFNDRQWEGVNAPDLDKPVFNFLKPVVNYYIAMITSDDIGVEIQPFGQVDEELRDVLQAAAQEVERVMENTKIRSKQKRMLRDAAVDGDGCFYLYFDPDIPRGTGEYGEICAENLENTQVLFGNPAVDDLQSQPFLLVVQHQPLDLVRRQALKNGIGAAGAEEIQPDSLLDPYSLSEDDVVTVITKFWKEDGTVKLISTTRNQVVRPRADTGYRLYPLVYFIWERVRHSYHGMAVLTGKISNQIFVNKLYAMAMQYVKNQAFPKLLFDRSKIDSWSNRVGDAIAVNGDPSQAVASSFASRDMSSQVLQLIDETISRTKDLMGASDAALGNINPQNTSAIIAVQKAASLSLELQKMEFYQFVEDYIRIFLEMMRVNYGVRRVAFEGPQGDERCRWIDFSRLQDCTWKLNVQIGAASYWSELMQVQTLDNLFLNGIIDDSIDYLQNVPQGYLRNKNELIAKLKARRREQERVEENKKEHKFYSKEGERGRKSNDTPGV
ncbi:MAG: hypothetical protein ACLRVT_07045 [Oscillospiraceae bacterium]